MKQISIYCCPLVSTVIDYCYWLLSTANMVTLVNEVVIHVKCLFCWSDIDHIWILLTDFVDSFISNFMKIRPAGAGLFHTKRRPDRHDGANCRCPQLCECWKNTRPRSAVVVVVGAKNGNGEARTFIWLMLLEVGWWEGHWCIQELRLLKTSIQT